MIEYIKGTGSTNADIAARLAGGDYVQEGFWLVADRQTAGRGRHGRDWFGGAGNFMGSTLVHIGFGDPNPGTLALVAGLSVSEVVSRHLPRDSCARLKWPNDILIGAAKLAGILLERVGDAVVVGIGVNLARAPQVLGRETIALAELGTVLDRNQFAEELATQFGEDVSRWRTFGLAPIISRWLSAGYPLGTALVVGEPGKPALHGAFAGLTPDGALQLRLADGTTRVIHAGEVRLAGSN